jgi:hypothetical protein
VEIREIDYQVPSLEEFMAIYQEDEKASEWYENIFQDEVQNGPQYGPGNSNSVAKNLRGRRSNGHIINVINDNGESGPFKDPLPLDVSVGFDEASRRDGHWTHDRVRFGMRVIIADAENLIRRW